MSEESLTTKTAKGVLWNTAEKIGDQSIQFVVSIILARLIMPDQFGMIAMLAIFFAIAQAFIDSGLTAALIRKKNPSQADCSTVFYFNMIMSCILYAALYFCAPAIARFYNIPELQLILRVSALTLPINSLRGVHDALFRANMNFGILTKYNLLSQITTGAIGIALAFMNYQVWAIVIQSLAAAIVGNIFIWWKSSWRPSWIFSKASFKEFFSFGSKLLASSLLDRLYTNAQGLLIGKFYTASSLAFYTRAESFRSISVQMPTQAIQGVTYPALCRISDNVPLMIAGYRRIIRMAAFVVFPVGMGLAAIAVPFINVLLTGRWIYTATLLPILCFSGILYPIHAVNLNILKVTGRSDLFLRLEVWKKAIGVATLCVTLFISIEAMCWGYLFTGIVALFINTYYTRKLYGYGIAQQLRDVRFALTASLIMYAAVYFLCAQLGTGILSLLTGILAGIAIYVAAAVIFKSGELAEIMNIFARMRKQQQSRK